jgi:hypothetical protein
MSRETRMAIEHSTRCRSVPRAVWMCVTKPKFSRFGIGKVGEAHAFTYEIAWTPEGQCWRSCKAF